MIVQDRSREPKISVLLVDASYRSHYEVIESLKGQTFGKENFEVLWVEYYDRVTQELRDKVKGETHFHVFTLNGSGVYHSSYCFNHGITHACGELLVIADADVLMEADFLETVWKEHQANDRLVMYIYRLDEPKRDTPYCFQLDYLKKNCVLTNPVNYGGCLTVRKKWLIDINGYEQHDVFRSGAHANGLDIYTRFKNMGMQIMWHPHLRLFHPWHPHQPNFASAYPPQKRLIEYRAKNLDVLSYQGIDATKNRGDAPSWVGQPVPEKKTRTTPQS